MASSHSSSPFSRVFGSRDHASAAPSTATGGRWVHGEWVPAERVERVTADAELASTPRGFHIPFRWEVAAYVTLVVIALLLRVWGLGDRAVHHDESLHGFFAWEIYQGRDYLHNPLTHGMFLFHAIAGSFFLFGDNEFTMRLPMALFGAGLVATPLLLRPRMGQTAALVAAVLLTFSPTLVYFSRFARNDIFVAVFTIVLIGAMFRYLDERRDRWLYVAAAAIALGFTAKENMYIVVGILGVYLVWRTAPELWEWLMGRHSLRNFSPEAGFLVLIGGITLPLFAAAFSLLDGPLPVDLSATNGTVGYATGEPVGTGSYIAAISIAVVLLVIGWGFGLAWNAKAWLISWAIFAGLFAFFFTNYFTHPGGVGSGVWQSLGYWIEQHDVRRGEQPWYYYFMMSSVYEFLPFVFAVGTAAFYAIRTGLLSWALLGIGAVFLSFAGYQSIQEGHLQGSVQVLIPTAFGVLFLLAFAMYVKTTSFRRFLLFWTIFTFAAYSFAGEKMPWLLTHLALPFIFVAATTIGDMLMQVRWRPSIRRGSYLLLAGVPLFLIMLWRLIFIDVDSNVQSFFTLFAILATLGMLGVGLQFLSSRIGHRAAWSSVAIVVALLMFGFTFRASWIANFVYEDVPQEVLVYTQTTQDIHLVAQEIRAAGRLTGRGDDLLVAIDTSDSYAWPWHWYLRGRDGNRFRDYSPDDVGAEQGVEVAVINSRNNAKVEVDYRQGYTEARRIQHRAWFPEDYRNLTPGKFWNTIWDRDRWRTSVDFFLYRRLNGNIGSVDSYVYFSTDIPVSPLN